MKAQDEVEDVVEEVCIVTKLSTTSSQSPAPVRPLS